MGNNHSRAHYPPDVRRRDQYPSRSRSHSRRPPNDWYGGYPGELGYRSDSQPYPSYATQTQYVQPSAYQSQQMVQPQPQPQIVQAVQPQVFCALL